MTTEPTPAQPSSALPAPALPPAEPVRRAVRVGRVLGRAASGMLVLGLAGAVVALGTVEPPVVATQAPLPTVEVPASGSALVCPGPVRLPTEPEPGEDVVYDPQFDPSPGESVSALGAVAVDGATAVLRTIDGADDGTELTGAGDVVLAQLADLGQGTVLLSEPSGDSPPWAAGSVGVRTLAGDLRGLVAGACQRAATEVWLVGGSTSLGSSARLVLQNPGLTAATVDITVWGPSGQAELAGAPQYLVPPGAERVVLLEGVAAEQRRIAIRLTAAGGQVTGYLQDSQLRGLLPAGVDQVTGGPGPATHQVVPAISVTDSEPDGVDTAQLRLLAPGEEPTTAQVTLLGEDGPVDLPGTAAIDLDPGAVIDVPLAGLPAGTYTAVVQATEPVVAAALLTRGDGVGQAEADPNVALERAWVAAAVLGSASGPLALPEGTDPTLALAVVPGEVSGAATVTLELVGEDGAVLAQERLTLAEGTTTALTPAELLDDAAEGLSAVVLRTEDPRVVWGAVLVVPDDAGELVSSLTPVPPETARPEVGVRIR